MERIKESWDSNSVTTVFRVSHKKGRPVGCEVTGARVFTDDCGLGWNFGIAYDTQQPEIDIFFHFTEDKWLASYGTSISLLTALPNDTNKGTSEKHYAERLTIPTPDEEHLISLDPSDIISNPRISFKVTFRAGVDMIGLLKKRSSLNLTTSAISPAIQAVLQRALITGMYFDTKFVTRSGRTSSYPTNPIYAHSAVLDAVHPAFIRLCSNSSTPDQAPIDDTDKDSYRGFECDISFDEYDSDSDFDPIEVNDEPDAGADASIESAINNYQSPNATLGESSHVCYPTQNAVRTVRIHGVAEKTLKALIYHCYTAEILFRPLRSSAAEKTKDEVVLPDRFHCSPKSMYRLADKIGADELKKLSLESIRSSLSKHNILDEVFSHFTSRYPEVLNMELELLAKNIREPEVVQALPGKMKTIASGALPHSDEILAKAFIQRMI
ncbi:hypothetical protein BJ138DRAFT_1115583 [Hygrophoropsis aurantiaca]|uniref:Uncharacterized protein n=1 Tax=Hygrophoropsis aurantiaca TaxID=72124 RepID=A0ACB8A5G7_9AGAM|nr:hypothetical protein BJ138DRAFT_1115583 [Hygrophoropsis aurantiaca]